MYKNWELSCCSLIPQCWEEHLAHSYWSSVFIGWRNEWMNGQILLSFLSRPLLLCLLKISKWLRARAFAFFPYLYLLEGYFSKKKKINLLLNFLLTAVFLLTSPCPKVFMNNIIIFILDKIRLKKPAYLTHGTFSHLLFSGFWAWVHW